MSKKNTSKSELKATLDNHAQTLYLQDQTAENYIENIVHLTNLPKILDEIGENKSEKRILEMGFGEGVITRELVGQGFKHELVEGSGDLVAHARLLYGTQIKIHHSLFEDFSPPPEKYDFILGLHVLEHVHNPEAIVKKIYSWLKPDGKVVIVVPNSESLHRRLAVALKLQPFLNSRSKRDEIVGHLRVYSLAELNDLFLRNGFRIDREFGYFIKTVPNGMMTGYSPELLAELTNISELFEPQLLANIGLVAIKR